MSRTIGNSIARLRAGEARHRADVDHLVHRRRQRDRRAGHARDPRAPHAAGDHDDVGLDVAARRAHRARRGRARRRCRAPRCSRDTCSAPSSCARSRMIVPEAQRVDDADRRRVEAAEDHRLVDERHELLHLGRRDERDSRRCPTTSPTPSGGAAPPSAPRCARPRCRRSREDAQLLVLAHRVERELRHLLRVVDREDEVRGVAGRAAGVRQRALVEQHEVAPAELGEVVGEAVADDAGADHDGAGAAGSGRLSHRRYSPARSTSRIACSKRSTCARIELAPRASPSPSRIASSSVAVLLDRLLELVGAVERQHPDAQREDVVLARASPRGRSLWRAR